MENRTRGTGKSKKIVIGVATIVAVAAIAVPTALTLTGGKDDAGASTENNKYNVIVSSGIDGVPDYSLTIADGTKISELKSILKGVDGYRIEGIYKDDAMNHPYSDNETISSSTKIYIKFVAVTYTVNIYAEDGTTLLDSQEVNHKDSLSLVAPTKAEDNFATYEFKGWYNERNELVNLNEITSDLNIHPYYETHMKDYRIGFIYEAFKSSVSVTIGGTPVDLNSTYHYGAKIVIRATQKVGRDITEFKVKVGTGETQDILTEAYRHEENGVVYYEYELDGNGDLSIIYSEAASEYSIGQIPSQVTVTRNGHTLSSNEAIYYGDQLEIKYSEDYEVIEFSVAGAELVTGNLYSVIGNVEITFDGEYKYSYLQFAACDGGYSVVGCLDSSLSEIIIPDTYNGEPVVSIGENVFFECTNLLKFKIGNNVTSLGRDILGSGHSLKSLFIGKSLNNINTDSISGEFYQLETIVVHDENETYTSKDILGNQVNAIINKSSKTLVKGCMTTTLPNDGSISRIGTEAFLNCNNLLSIEIPDNITIIENYAFFQCFNLKSVKLSKNLAIIGNSSFGNCYELNSISLPNGLLSLGAYAFSCCLKVKSVVIPESVESIGGYAFNNCSALSSITISNNVKTIGISAFSGCESLLSVEIPSGISVIENELFRNCNNLKSIIIPESIKSIKNSAFLGCSSLKNVTIKSSEIYSYATGINYDNIGALLANATEVRVLKSIVDSNSNSYLMGENFAAITDGDYYVFVPVSSYSYLTFIKCDGGFEVSAFNKDSIITEVVIPETYQGEKVVSIGRSVFSDCTNLISVTIPENIERIGGAAFSNCYNLSNIYFNAINCEDCFTYDEDYGEISNSVFTFAGIKSGGINVIFGDKVQRIPSYLFEDRHLHEDYCDTYSANIKSVVIGENVREIGESAFYNCLNLSEITIKSSYLYELYTEYLGGLSSTTTILKILSTIDDRTNNFILSNYTQQSEGEYNTYKHNLIYSDENYIYEYNNNTDSYFITDYIGTEKDIIIPTTFNGKKVTSISGINYNNIIESVYIPEEISLFEYSFYYCSNLKTVTVNSGSYQRRYKFNGCSAITTLIVNTYSAYNNLDSFSYYDRYENAAMLYAKEIRVLKTVDDGSKEYLNENFTKTDGGAYWIYTRK